MLASPVERLFFFFFNDTATTEIYTLSLHDALPIYSSAAGAASATAESEFSMINPAPTGTVGPLTVGQATRSEEHTSELQSHLNLVCRLLLEKKKYRK